MTRRVIRFPIAEPRETALVAATEVDREQLEQLRDHVAALLAAMPPPPPPAPESEPKPDRSPWLAGLPEGVRGGGSIEWKWIGRGQRRFGPYRGKAEWTAHSTAPREFPNSEIRLTDG